MLKQSEKFEDKFKTNLVTNSLLELGDDISDEAKGKGRKFVSRFIEAGVAHYRDFGDVLITKETLDKFINTMIGCPVIITHKDIDDNNADKERVGVVSEVWYNSADGWYYCSGIIWNKKAIDLVKNQGWSVSCTYDFESDNQAKTHNGKKIDREFTNGEFLHLALVDNPRYERANIVMNGKDEVNQKVDNGWITTDRINEDGEIQKEIENQETEQKQAKNSIETERKENITMTALNDLENFVRGIVENACKKEVENEKDDKRKLIDEVAGMMKSAGADDELIRTAIAKMEKIAYEKSEADTADNNCKNEKEEVKEEMKEEKEADKAEPLEEKEEEKDEKEDEFKKEKEIVKNSSDENDTSAIDKTKEIVYNSNSTVKSSYVTRDERLKLGDNY